jgi:trimethylamine:corrinoid methyltransferase-like protein
VGTPELAHVNLMIGQLARRYRCLPSAPLGQIELIA